MSVYLLTNTSIRQCLDGILCVPIHTQLNNMHTYPYCDLREKYVLECSHYRRVIKDGRPEMGELLYSDANKDEKILWMICHTSNASYYKLKNIEKCVIKIAKNRLHDYHDLYFPLIGYYKEDGVEQKEVLRIVLKHLSDGKKRVICLTHY